MEESGQHISKSFWGNKVLFFYLNSKSPCSLFAELLHTTDSPLKIVGSGARGGGEQDGLSSAFLYDFCISGINEFRCFPSPKKTRLKRENAGFH